MSETAKISIQGVETELPLLVGTENEVGIDISGLRAATGAVTLDFGYKNTGSTTSSITYLDGEAGILRHRGYSIEELADKAEFLEVAYLLINGELPTKEQYDAWDNEIRRHTLVNTDIQNMFDAWPTGSHPMGQLIAMISSLSSFVTAGAGVKVAKHGNYGVSSACGSSNVMEYLGVKFSKDEAFLKRSIDKAGICVLHAPLFHPAMKNVAPIRRELGVKTFFNMLGPLVNPSNPQNQLVGVFNLELARIYSYLLQESSKNYGIVYSLDGYDEISLTNGFKLITKENELQITPEDLGLKRLEQSEIFGGNSVKASAEIFISILDGKGTEAQNNTVLTNAAFALKIIEPTKSFENAFEEAKTSLLGLKAKECLIKLI